MYQELIVFEDSFDSAPIWGTECNTLPLPTLAIGDIFEAPAPAWHGKPGKKPIFRVTAVKHVFSDNGPGPEADHTMMITVVEDSTPTHEEQLREADEATALEEQRSTFMQTMLQDLARQQVPALMDSMLQSIRQAMKNEPAHGIASTGSAWQEAASILQADGHMLVEILIEQLASQISHAVRNLRREDRLVLWLAFRGLKDDLSQNDLMTLGNFEPHRDSDALVEAREQLLEELQYQLQNAELG